MNLKALTGTHQLKAKIDLAIKVVRKSSRIAVKTVKSLKSNINELELSTIEKSRISVADTDDLNSAMEKLDKFTDSVISDSAKAWEKYRGIKRECDILGFEPARMENLRTLCAEYEQLAKDLLCYSLGHFKQVSHA